MSRRRVGITGIGAVTPLGVGFEPTWKALLAGTNSVSTIQGFDASEFPTTFAAECGAFDPAAFFSTKEVRRLDPFAQFALVAAAEAVEDAGIDLPGSDPGRAGCVIGSGVGGLIEIEAAHSRLLERGPGRMSAYSFPKLMLNAATGETAIRYGLEGVSHAVASACATGTDAVGAALRTIQYADADVMLAGGSEAAVTPLAVGGFSALKALSRRNDDPARASRPFDVDRDGFVLGEGAAILVLEEMERAKRRGARIYAEVMGYRATSDAHHISAPRPDGRVAAAAMSGCLQDAGISGEDVGYVNAHGTSTLLNDAMETRAIKQVFGEHAAGLAVSSTKSMIGHLLGAAGAVEAAVAARSVADGIVHPTLNLDRADPECDLDYVPGSARECDVRAALSNSFGFGGHNASLVLGAV